MAEITTAVKICNVALGHLGKPPITTIGESSRGGLLCDLYYEGARNALLRAHPWNFATKFADLAEDAVESAAITEGFYEYAFTLPTDCLKVRRTSIEAAGLAHDYRIVKRFVYTNEETCAIEYTYKCTTVGDYDAMFIMLLALDLAILMCMQLANNASLRRDLIDQRANIAPEIRTTNAQEGSTRDPLDNSGWVTARL